MKKHLLIIAILWLFSWASFAQTVATEPSGNGTEGTPYQIETLANLLWITENPEHWDKYYLQTADIDATETASWNEGEGWVPIGTMEMAFAGNYNGGGFSISNLYINRPGLEAVGLFGRTNGAIVTQINLDNVSVVGMQRIGAIIGYALFETNISYCSSSGNLSGGNFVGGLVGNLYNASSISNSYSSANVEHNGDGFQQTGGLVGRLLDGHLSNCYATGNVQGDNWAGGLVGNSTNNSSITNSYSVGFVTGVARVGGLVGESSDTELTSCYWNNESSGQSVSGGGTGKTTAEMLLTSTYQDWDFDGIWEIQEETSYPYLSLQGTPSSFNYPITELPPTNLVAEQGDGSILLTWNEPAIDLPSSYNIYRNNTLLTNTTSTSYTDSDVTNYTTYSYYVKAVFNEGETLATNTASVYYFLGFAGGDGTESNPYQIADAGQLSGMRKYSNAYFIQTADIDLGVAPWNQDEGWQPVHFGGVYNGNGFTITNLTINRPGNSNIGLFGYCSGEVLNLKNITITNANVNGSSYTGILAGYIHASNQEAITRCNVDGTVTSSMNQVGGIVGYFRDGSISKSSAQVTVNGNDYLGGAVGFFLNASITECYSTAIINGTSYIGGLVGQLQHSTITNCYANGSITGYSAGGLLGQTYNTVVTNSFSFTQITPQDNGEGGLIGIGWGMETTCENSYWDTEFSGLTESYGGVGKTTAEMKDITTFLDADWDFKGLGAEGIWNMGNDRNNGYPYLSWQYPDDPEIAGIFDGGDGSDENPFLISNAEQLNNVRLFLNAYYLQTADIDLGVAPWNEGEGWVPIGVDANNDFTGTYNGGDYTISNLTINRPTANYQGLFGSAENATIINIRLVNVNIVGAARTGAIVGQTQYSTIEKCLSTGTVTGTSYVGGLIGFNNYSNITQCFSSVNVTGTNYIGGITGVHQGGNLLLNSYSTGNLAGGNYVGGLVGTTAASSQIKKSFYAGEIVGDSGLGGIVAYRYSASDAFNCFWDTEASGVSTTEVGGEGKTTAEMKDIYTYTSTGWDFKGLGEEGIWNIEPDGYPYLSWINPTNDGPEATVVANIIANEITNITGTEATINGTITCIGYPAATQHGICWNTTGSPTIDDDKTVEGAITQAGTFTSTASGLTPNTTYYVRAYATNGEGTSYSNEFTFVTVVEPTGNGTPETPYQISNLAELYWIAITPSVWDKHFIQTADIDATQTLGWNNGEGWIPIGNEEELFAGDYNGNKHLITNLHIDRPNSNYIGLFGGVYAAKIYDLGLLDVNIVGGSFSAGFSGWLQNSQLERCFVTGSVEGKSGHTGSLIGCATEGSIIKNSYSNANLTGYTGTSAYGGLAGGIYGSNVSNCFMSGIVSLPMGGGLIGYATESEVTGSFWDTETSGFTSSAGGTGKTTAEMNDITTFLDAGWDFKGLGAEGVWNIGNDRNNGYPYLSWQYPDDPAISIEILPSAVITDVTSITQTSATINIDVTNIGNPQGTQFGVCWSSTNTEPTTSDDNELSSEPFALGNYTIDIGALDNSTTYYARAFASNTNGTAYSDVFIFNTECGAHPLPLTENFDNISEFPYCWNAFTVGGGSVLIYSFEPTSNPNHAWLFADAIGVEAYLVLPELDADFNTLNLQFMSKSGVTHLGWPADMVLEIGTMTNPTDASTFTYFTHIQTQDFYEQQNISLATYSGTDKYIAFRVSSNIQEQRGYVFIDDIAVNLSAGYNVTFNVDMSPAAGFDPNTDVVYLTGSMFNWDAPGDDPDNQTMTRVDDSMIWTKTLQLTANSYEYKYYINAGWDGGELADGSNRYYTVAGESTKDDTWGGVGNCYDAINLKTLTSPYSGTTTTATNNFSLCGMDNSKDLVFYYDVADGELITIWQSWNSYDSRHTLRWGGDCPGIIEIACIDDPDTDPVSWYNNTGATQRVWFILAGFSDSHGDFTLSWETETIVCNGATIPLVENFDNYNIVPPCWSTTGTNNYEVDVTDHNRFSTPNSARLYHESSSYAILATPEIAGGIQDLRLRFKALLGYCPSIGNLYVGSMTDPTDASTFTSLKMFEVTNQPGEDWHSFEVWFDEYTGSDAHIAFRLGDGTSSEYVRAFIDDVEIEAIPSCPEPHNLTLGVVTQTTAEISWDAPGVSLFEIAYGPKGFNPQSEGDIISGISSTTHTLTDLNHSTAYEVYIRSTCGTETSGWSYPATFTTECGVHTLPLTENFDNSTSLPLCWNISGYNYFEVDITDHRSFSTPKSARLYHGSSSYAILATPEIAGGIQDLRLRFKALLGYCPSIGNLYVGSMTDPTDVSTFTSIQMFEVTNKPGDDWHSFEVWFDEYTGSDTHIAFRLGDVTSTEWTRAFIDNIIIDIIPGCFEPFDLFTDNTTQTTAVVGWTEPATSTQWDIVYGPKGFNPLTQGELVTGVTENPYTLTDLNPSTIYEFYVRTYCDGTPSGWSLPAEFSTDCGPTAVPITENFDNSISLPHCWSGLGSYNVLSGYSYSAPNMVYVYTASISSTSHLITPEIENDLNNLQINFMARNYSDNSMVLEIGTMSDPTNASTFTYISHVQTGVDYQPYSISMVSYTGTDKYIAFKISSNIQEQAGYVFIDDIEIVETHSVTFSVVGTPANGTLTAKVDGIAITSGDYIVNSKAVEFTATPLEDYRVKRWTNNGTTVAGNTTNSYTVSGIQQNTSVTVEFEEIPPVVYTLTLVVSPANAGTVTGEGEYEAAEQVTIKASPAEGFVFTGWTGNVAEPLDATTTFTMPAEDATVTANFEPEQPETFTVTFTVKSNTQEPIEDAEISVDSEVITTNSNGEASTSLANGSYTYSVTATGYEEHSGNFSVSGANKSIAITLVAVGNNVELLSNVEIYPNPFDQKIVIKGIEGVQRIAITNVAGQLIKNIKIANQTEITIGTGNINAGTYIVTLYYTNGEMQNRKIVKVN